MSAIYWVKASIKSVFSCHVNSSVDFCKALEKRFINFILNIMRCRCSLFIFPSYASPELLSSGVPGVFSSLSISQQFRVTQRKKNVKRMLFFRPIYKDTERQKLKKVHQRS